MSAGQTGNDTNNHDGDMMNNGDGIECSSDFGNDEMSDFDIPSDIMILSQFHGTMVLSTNSVQTLLEIRLVTELLASIVGTHTLSGFLLFRDVPVSCMHMKSCYGAITIRLNRL